MTVETALPVLAVVFTALLVKATVGFGEALIAMPLLVTWMSVRTASPLIGLVGLATTLLMAASGWREIDLRATWRLVLAHAAGLPFGLLLVKFAPERLVTALLGLVLVGYGMYSLLRPRLARIQSPVWAFPFGFTAGILGSAYNTSGPPIVMYATMNGWPPERFRATLQGCFVPTGILISAGQGIAGLWTREVLMLSLICLPLVPVALWLGGWLARRIPAQRFQQVVYAGLVALGILVIL